MSRSTKALTALLNVTEEDCPAITKSAAIIYQTLGGESIRLLKLQAASCD
jgi:hypothetical protein